MSVTEIVNRMFIFFAFSLYNMPFSRVTMAKKVAYFIE